jgi:hypothetical protein
VRRRLSLLLVGALTAIMPLIVTPAASAGPQPVDLTCVGKLTATFSPGVTLASVNQTVTVEIKAGSDFQDGLACTSANANAYQGVTATVTLTGKVSCIVGSFLGDGTLVWDNGDVSAVSVRATSIGAVPLIDARITSGALIGSRAVVLGVPTAFSGLCITPVTRISYMGAGIVLKL